MAKPDPNPYAPPTAPIGETSARTPGKPTSEERIRREFLSHETSLRSVGSLHYLAALLGVIFLVVAIASERGRPLSTPGTHLDALLGYLAFVAFHATLGYGMDRLKPWARWVEAFLVALTFLGFLIGFVTVAGRGDGLPPLIACGLFGTIPAYILYLLLGRKGEFIFSTEYRDVVAQTGHVKPRTGLVAWGCFVIVVAVPAVGTIVWSILRIYR